MRNTGNTLTFLNEYREEYTSRFKFWCAKSTEYCISDISQFSALEYFPIQEQCSISLQSLGAQQRAQIGVFLEVEYQENTRLCLGSGGISTFDKIRAV